MASKSICINCSTKIPPSGTRSGNLFFKKVKVSIQEALCSLYQLPKDSLDDLEENEVLCCKKCTSILQDIYKLLVEFQSLQNATSRLREIMLEKNGHRLNEESIRDVVPATIADKINFTDEAEDTEEFNDTSPLSPNPESEDSAASFSPNSSVTESESEPEKEIMKESKTKSKPRTKNAFKILIKNSKGRSKSRLKQEKKKTVKKRKPRKSGEPSVCEHCNEPFPNWTILKKHLRQVHKQHLYACDKCGKQFQQNRSLERHSFTHEGIKTQICHLCGKPFLHKDDLHKHLRVHEHNAALPNNYHCGECNASFRTQKLLLEHYDSVQHDDPKPFKCKICNAAYDLVGSLRRHELLHEGNVTRPFRCEQCPSTFGHKFNLRNHMATVHGLGKDGADSLLGISIKRVPALIEGEQGVQNIKECTECQLSFGSLRELQRHVEGTIHADTKPLKCVECGAGFGSAHGRKLHFRAQHSGVQLSFACCVCGRVIANRNTYRVHLVKQHQMSKEDAKAQIELATPVTVEPEAEAQQ